MPYVYEYFTKYWTGDCEISTREEDELWDLINVDNVAVALSCDYIKEHNLEPSEPFPWDSDKSVYYLKVYHHLHC